MDADYNEKEHDHLLYQNFRWLSEAYWNAVDAGIRDLVMLVLDLRSPVGRQLAEALVTAETVERIAAATPNEMMPSLVWGGARPAALNALRTAFAEEPQTGWRRYMEMRLSDPLPEGDHDRFVMSRKQLSCCRIKWPKREDERPPETQASP